MLSGKPRLSPKSSKLNEEAIGSGAVGETSKYHELQPQVRN
jgi:hypothetical protein